MLRKILYLVIVMIIAVIVAPNISNASGGGGAAVVIQGREQQKANDKAAEMMYKGAISPKVFKSAEKFLREKFPEVKAAIVWNASRTGFTCYCEHDMQMTLEWNGTFIVIKRDLFLLNGKTIYRGDWTQWQ